MSQLIVATPEAVIAALKTPAADGRIIIAGSRVKKGDVAARALMPVVSKRRSRKDETVASEPRPRKVRARQDTESDGTSRRRGRVPAPLNLGDPLKTTGYVLKVLDANHFPHYYNRDMGTWDIVKPGGQLFQIPVVEIQKITGQELLSRLAA